MRKKIYQKHLLTLFSINPFCDYKRSHWIGMRIGTVKKGGITMTANQINFAALQETKRSNLAKEELTRTSNTINQAHFQRADTAAAKQAETAYLNALTNRRNADINAYNASIAKQNADTNARNVAVAESLAPSEVALNQARTNESLVGAWATHPFASAAKWTADNAGRVVDAARSLITSNPSAATGVVRVATATTPNVLVNAAVKSIIDLPKMAIPAGIVPLPTRKGGRKHE